jgi:prepilin-type processing-associated H-X9-DG protein
MAVLSYAADHDGTLPGPANSGQAAECPSTGSPYQLIYILANYLGPYGPPVAPYTVRPNTWYSPVFECPAARKIILAQNKTLTGAIYYVTTYLLFGFPPNIAQPMRLVNIPSLQTMVVMRDADQTFYGKGAPTVAAAPPHGSYRNTLYLDGHVEPVPVKP